MGSALNNSPLSCQLDSLLNLSGTRQPKGDIDILHGGGWGRKVSWDRIFAERKEEEKMKEENGRKNYDTQLSSAVDQENAKGKKNNWEEQYVSAI